MSGKGIESSIYRKTMTKKCRSWGENSTVGGELISSIGEKEKLNQFPLKGKKSGHHLESESKAFTANRKAVQKE